MLEDGSSVSYVSVLTPVLQITSSNYYNREKRENKQESKQNTDECWKRNQKKLIDDRRRKRTIRNTVISVFIGRLQ